MKIFRIFLILLLGLSTAACSSDELEWNDGGGNAGGSSSGDTSGDDLETFSIAFNTAALSESETIPSDETDENYDDYVEYSDFTSQIKIAYASDGVSIEGEAEGVEVTTDGTDVTVNASAKGVDYVLSGTCAAGSFKIYSDKKFKLTLNGLTLSGKNGAAINVQSKKRVFVECAAGTVNTLKDSERAAYNTPDDEDEKAAFFSEGQLLFSGSGQLIVTGQGKNGICSDDYVFIRPQTNIKVTATASNGIKANDYIRINGGVLNIGVSATAGKGLKSGGHCFINGGRTTIITTGGGEYDADEGDTSACAGVKCDSNFVMNGGELYAKSSGKGGKGISADEEMTINDGTLCVITTGSRYTYSSKLRSSPKGLKTAGNMTINGGTVRVRTAGGEGSEGIESKKILTINGGTVEVSAYDDAINAGKQINIAGGSIYAYASNNDGIDSNGTLNISGGTIVACGTTQPEDGFDCDNNTFTITGGTLIGIGGGSSSPTTNTCTQPSILYGGSGSQGTYIALDKSDGTNILTYKIPRAYNQMTLLISSPDMTKGSTCTLKSGVSLSGGTTWHGLTTGGTASNGSTISSVTLSSMLTTIGNTSTGGGGGGNPPSGRR